MANVRRPSGRGAGLALLLFVVACLAAPLAALPSVPSDTGAGGRIQGRVIDRTAPPHPLARQAVSLAIIERAATSERRTTSDGGGRFAFADLPVGGIRVFVLATEYRGVQYESDRIHLSPDAPARSVDLVVYERVQDRASIRAPVVFAVVDVAPGGIHVGAIQRFDNPTDRTALPTGADPLLFPLPSGAQAVTFLAGWRNPRVADGMITDAIPLLPGALQVAYAFGVETRGRDLSFPWRLPYGASDVEILVEDAGIRVRAEGLHPAGTVAGPRGSYARWSGGPVPQGGQVEVRLSGLPASRSVLPAAVGAALAVALGGGLLWALRRPAPTRA